MEQLTLNMIPNGYTPTAHISQYDAGRHIRFNLQNINLAGNETVTLKIRKTNGELVTKTIENHTSYVEYVSEKADCDVSGKANCEIIIANGDVVIGSKNFILNIEADPYDGAGVVTETASGAIATFETNVVDVLQSVKCEIKAKQDLHGEDKPYPAGGGVNLFDKTTIFNGYINDDNGEFRPNNNYKATDFIAIKGGQNYYIKTEQSGANWGAWYDSEKNYISGLTDYTNKVKTAPSNAYYVRFTIWGIDEGGNFDTFGVNYPATDTAYHPYENICPIEGFTEANITRCGVNLININGTEFAELQNPDVAIPFVDGLVIKGLSRDGYVRPANVSYSVSGDKVTINTSSSSYGVGFAFRAIPNTDYYVSCSNSFGSASVYYDKDGKWIGDGGAYVSGNNSFTTPNNCAWCVIILKPNSINVDTDFNEPLVNFGTTKATYAPYNGQIYTIAIGQEVFGGQLIILPDRTYFHVTHYYDEYDENENWNVGSGNAYFAIFNQPASKSNNDLTQLCNILKGGGNDYQSYGKFRAQTNGAIVIGNKKPDETLHWNDLNAFKADVALNHIQVCYELATPFDIDLTPQQIEALLGINNVWHDGNGNTEVKYLYDA